MFIVIVMVKDIDCKVRVRTRENSELGDKFSGVQGQKSTIGILYDGGYAIY